MKHQKIEKLFSNSGRPSKCILAMKKLLKKPSTVCRHKTVAPFFCGNISKCKPQIGRGARSNTYPLLGVFICSCEYIKGQKYISAKIINIFDDFCITYETLHSITNNPLHSKTSWPTDDLACTYIYKKSILMKKKETKSMLGIHFKLLFPLSFLICKSTFTLQFSGFRWESGPLIAANLITN